MVFKPRQCTVFSKVPRFPWRNASTYSVKEINFQISHFICSFPKMILPILYRVYSVLLLSKRKAYSSLIPNFTTHCLAVQKPWDGSGEIKQRTFIHKALQPPWIALYIFLLSKALEIVCFAQCGSFLNSDTWDILLRQRKESTGRTHRTLRFFFFLRT